MLTQIKLIVAYQPELIYISYGLALFNLYFITFSITSAHLPSSSCFVLPLFTNIFALLLINRHTYSQIIIHTHIHIQQYQQKNANDCILNKHHGMC